MTESLALLGLVIIVYALWRDRNRQEKQKAELLEYKQIHEDLVKAGNDVKNLLEHMEQTSENIVEDITIRLEEIKDMEKSLREKVHQESELREKRDQEKELQARAILETLIPDYVDTDKLLQKDEVVEGASAANTIEFPVHKQVSANPTGKGKTNSKHKKQSVKEPVVFNEATPKQQMVYAMSNLGYSEEEIARNMSIGKGEVRLILELKRKGEKNNA